MLAVFGAFRKRPARKPLAVKLQPVDDLVDHLALGAHRKPNQIKLGADHGADRLAVGGGPRPRLLRSPGKLRRAII